MRSGSSNIWDGDDDDDEPIIGNADYTEKDLQQHQARIVDDQNQGLEALSKIISRQRDLALQIGDEVEIQNGEISVVLVEFLVSNAILQILSMIWPMTWSALTIA